MSTIEKALGYLKQAPAADDSVKSQTRRPQNTEADSQRRAAPESGTAAYHEPEDFAPPPAPAARQQHQHPKQHQRNVINIPFDNLHAAGYLTPATPRSKTAEEFRTIKRPLLKNIAGQSAGYIKNANLIMVTSALEGDGKTFSSLNLAISIAMEQDKTVLYIDADVLKASAGRLLGVPNDTPGLIDILLDDTIAPEDVILSTNMEKLRILPAGIAHEHATELLASENMQRLMLELSTRYPDRVIVFDSPPLLLTTEAGVLASFMGQIVFVAAANVTPEHAVREALEHIGEDKMVAVMLNLAPGRRFNPFGIGHSYGYGYGYGYGHREGQAPEAAEAQKP